MTVLPRPLVLCCLLWCSPPYAAPLIAVDGTPDPLYGAAMSLQGDAPGVLTTGWRLEHGAEQVQIEAVLARTHLQGVTGHAWLSTAIGSGAGGADLVAYRSLALPYADLSDGDPALGWVSLFDGLTLAPGTYYLTLAADSSWAGWWGAATASVTQADGAELLGFDFTTSAAAVNVAMPWASDFANPLDWPARLMWRLSGDLTPPPATVPEPGGLPLLAAALAAAALRLRRRG
jgi:hypothetical protein